MSDLAVLVVSCDAYEDLWSPFFTLLRRHWPDCPYAIYLGSNHLEYRDSTVITLPIGEDRSWSEGVRLMVESIDAPYLLLLLEDFLLRRPVNSARIASLHNSMQRLNGGYLRLKPFPPPDVRLARFQGIGEIEPGAPYRVSLQAAIWDKEVFLRLLEEGETAWELEVFGSRRSDTLDCGFYSVWKPAIDYELGVTLGKWTPRGVATCRQQGIHVDLTRRAMMTAREAASLTLRSKLTAIFNRVPWRWRERLLLMVRSTGLRRPRPMPGR